MDLRCVRRCRGESTNATGLKTRLIAGHTTSLSEGTRAWGVLGVESGIFVVVLFLALAGMPTT